MQRTLRFLPLLLIVPFQAQAQVPNGGFENWTWTMGNEEPDGWMTDNLMGLFFGTTFATEGVGTEGTSCLVLTTRDLPDLGLRASVAFTGASSEGPTGYPVTTRPELLTGQLKYAPVGSDAASITVAITRWDPVAGERVLVGTGVHTVPSGVLDWAPFELPITYLDPATPDTALILLTSSVAPTAAGSVFSVDALAFVEGTGVNDAESLTLGAWPVPSESTLHVQAPVVMRAIEVLDVAGRVVGAVTVNGTMATLDVESLPSGQYAIRAFGSDGPILHGRFLKR